MRMPRVRAARRSVVSGARAKARHATPFDIYFSFFAV